MSIHSISATINPFPFIVAQITHLSMSEMSKILKLVIQYINENYNRISIILKQHCLNCIALNYKICKYLTIQVE